MPRAPKKPPAGMAGFSIVWAGQVLSLLGTAMSNFGLTIWAFKQTGRATDLALIGFFFMLPMLLTMPIIGVLVDRYNRKLMMMVSDLAAGVVTIVLLVLYLTGSLQIWHLFATSFISGIFQGFQWPAYSAAITLMLDKKHYTRASSMLQLAQSGSNIFAPLAAGALLDVIGLQGILLFDIITFVFAIGTLFFVHIPEPERTTEHRAGQSNRLPEAASGFRYIKERPSLLWLQSLFMVGNFFSSIGFTLLAPMILARTGSNEVIFGGVQTIGALGGVAGGLIIGAWGGFKRRINGVLIGWTLTMASMIVTGLGRPEPAWAGLPVWGTSTLVGAFCGTLINASNQAIWQTKVAPDVQGRVFSIRSLIAIGTVPLAQLAAGPLADRVFEPAMQPGGALASALGWLVGTGAGAGMSLIFILAGGLGLLTSLVGYALPTVRNVEDILPDHDALSGALALAEAGVD